MVANQGLLVAGFSISSRKISSASVFCLSLTMQVISRQNPNILWLFLQTTELSKAKLEFVRNIDMIYMNAGQPLPMIQQGQGAVILFMETSVPSDCQRGSRHSKPPFHIQRATVRWVFVPFITAFNQWAHGNQATVQLQIIWMAIK